MFGGENVCVVYWGLCARAFCFLAGALLCVLGDEYALESGIVCVVQCGPCVREFRFLAGPLLRELGGVCLVVWL